MAEWLTPDWHGMLAPSKPLPEIVLRGTLVYLILFGLLRAVLHRQAGGISVTDMLLFMRRNMRRESMTEEELRSELRKQGIEDHHQVQEAFMEGDGHISVIKKPEPLAAETPKTHGQKRK